MNAYTDNGYDGRRHYLLSMAEDYDVPYAVVCSIAELFGPDEDFDGLVTALQDYQGCDHGYNHARALRSLRTGRGRIQC